MSMHRSLVRWKVDPTLVVQRRLPWHVRKQQLRQQLWQGEGEEERQEPSDTPGIVVEIAQQAKRRNRDKQLWSNLLDQALASQGELTPQDMASVLTSMAQARFQHNRLLDEFVRSLSYRSNVKVMVTAMVAVDKLGLPTDGLRRPFLQQLSGSCEQLSFGDLRRVLMALARCWKASPVDQDLLDEICDTLVSKAEDCDPRDLVMVPQHLGRLQHLHMGLLGASANAVATLIASRLAVLPLDALRVLDGLLLLVPLHENAAVRERLGALAQKCRLLARELLRELKSEDLWRTGAQLAGAEVTDHRVWGIWSTEVLGRRDEGTVVRAQRVAQVRKRIRRQWGLGNLPEGLELALRGGAQPGRV